MFSKRLSISIVYVFCWKLTVYFYPKSIEDDDTMLSTGSIHKMDEAAPIDGSGGLQEKLNNIYIHIVVSKHVEKYYTILSKITNTAVKHHELENNSMGQC